MSDGFLLFFPMNILSKRHVIPCRASHLLTLTAFLIAGQNYFPRSNWNADECSWYPTITHEYSLSFFRVIIILVAASLSVCSTESRLSILFVDLIAFSEFRTDPMECGDHSGPLSRGNQLIFWANNYRIFGYSDWPKHAMFAWEFFCWLWRE